MYDDVEAGFGFHKDFTWEDLIAAGRAKEINMKASGKWNDVDPRNAQILALTTKVAELNTCLSTMSGATSGGGGTKASTPSNKGPKTADEYFNRPNAQIQRWRTVKQGPTIKKDGKTYYWCSHHKHPMGFYDGLYVTSHKETDHQRWIDSGKN